MYLRVTHGTLCLLVALTITLSAAHAQVRSGPVRDGPAPVSATSTNVRTGSRPVSEGRCVRDGSLGPLSGNPVRESGIGSMRSGPVSDISMGPVRGGRSGGVAGDPFAAAPATQWDTPSGLVFGEPVHDLGPLQDQLRALHPLSRDGDDMDDDGYDDLADDPDVQEATVAFETGEDGVDAAEGSTVSDDEAAVADDR